MKNIVKLFAITGMSAMILTSCSDFLDQTSPSEMTDTAIFNSTTYTQQALNKVYAGLTKDETYAQVVPLLLGLNSDIELVDGLGESGVTSNNERGMCNYNPQMGWNKIDRNWTGMYEAIENANIVIEGVENSSLLNSGEASAKSKMLAFKGEALTLRAMLYLDLIRTYGDVPMKFETTKADGSNIYLSKTDRDEIFERMITDLEEAIEYLPWAGSSSYTTERINKGFAHGLLARVAMTYAGYSIREASKPGYETLAESDVTFPTQRPAVEKRKELYTLAMKHLDAIIASGVHKLNPSYENQWYLINQLTLDQTYKENLYEVAHGVSFSGELGYTVGIRINGKTTYYGAKGNSSGKMKLTAAYFWSFDHNDLRRDLTFANFEIKEGENGNTIENMAGNNPFGLYVGKWDPRKMTDKWLAAARASADKVATGINNVMMRYADVLLLYAEVVNELNGADGVGPTCGLTARKALEEVRSRAFDASHKAEVNAYVNNLASGEQFFNALVDERAWEFAGECVRKWDLVRWGLLSKKIEESKAAYLKVIEEAPEKLYYKMKESNPNEIDPTSICWYEEPAVVEGYKSVDFWGKEDPTTGKNVNDNLPYISSGLNSKVKNRHVFPLGTTTVSNSNGVLKNSYGF
ncbi:RagB/SusD family nutrient uptake outer membrane protein [uncultured Bacteroides sp.]|uniref:RagB/SusD family nutrient uptake outer membrane protein n=1 Tax=uncultured Bacteroides sp. TaxID=162156 RepID=UPI002617D66A|nr:RagB/SusD family nutrient uptake outer membrane protein [uncultured Bacteroides sp.]